MTGFRAVGNLSIDDLVYADGATRWCMPGGNAAYAALGMAVWGGRPEVTAVYGPDYPVDALADRVDLSKSRQSEVTLRNWGLYEEDGSRTFVFRRYVSEWLRFCPDVQDLGESAIEGGHIAPLPWRRQAALATALRRRGARVLSVDPDDRGIGSVPSDDIVEMLRLIDAFLPSRQDVEALFPDASPVEALRRLRGLGPETAVIGVKLGAEGVILHRAGEASYAALPSVASQVRDATGAGDAFCGGFLVGYARSGDAVTAALMGSVSAAIAVEGIGIAELVSAAPEKAEVRLSTLSDRLTYHPF